jgi:segregation and condensation protein B
MVTLNGIVEALLFSAPAPLTAKQVAQLLREASEYSDEPNFPEFKDASVTESLRVLSTQYDQEGRAFQLIERTSGWQLISRPEYANWIRQLYPELRPSRLSAPGLETLAIIAYRQPVTKADVEAIRGVGVDGLLQKLLETGLIKIAGRADVPGRPLLYETTRNFLEHFGLRSLEELPNAAELRLLSNVAERTSEKAKENHASEEESGQNESIAERDPETDRRVGH